MSYSSFNPALCALVLWNVNLSRYLQDHSWNKNDVNSSLRCQLARSPHTTTRPPHPVQQFSVLSTHVHVYLHHLLHHLLLHHHHHHHHLHFHDLRQSPLKRLSTHCRKRGTLRGRNTCRRDIGLVHFHMLIFVIFMIFVIFIIFVYFPSWLPSKDLILMDNEKGLDSLGPDVYAIFFILHAPWRTSDVIEMIEFI